MSSDPSAPSEFDRRIDLETLAKFVERTDGEFGDAVVLQHQGTRQRFLMKEKIFTDRQSFLEELNKARNRKSFNHQNILHFVDYSVVTKIDKADQTYKVRLFFDYFPDNVRREIDGRLKRGTDFSVEEMTYLVYDTISACAFLQERGVNHGDLSPEVLLRTPDGHYVIGDKLRKQSKHPQNLIDKFIRGDKLFLSPELFRFIKTRNGDGIDRMDFFKSDVFILGMCILEAGIMTDVTQIYKRGNSGVDRALLGGLLDNFEGRYHENPLVCAVLRKMLEVEESQRPDFVCLKYSLPFYEDVLNFFRDQHAKQGALGNRGAAVAPLNRSVNQAPPGARSNGNVGGPREGEKGDGSRGGSGRNIQTSNDTSGNFSIFNGAKPAQEAPKNLPPPKPDSRGGMQSLQTQPANQLAGNPPRQDFHPNSAQKIERPINTYSQPAPSGFQSHAPQKLPLPGQNGRNGSNPDMRSPIGTGSTTPTNRSGLGQNQSFGQNSQSGVITFFETGSNLTHPQPPPGNNPQYAHVHHFNLDQMANRPPPGQYQTNPGSMTTRPSDPQNRTPPLPPARMVQGQPPQPVGPPQAEFFREKSKTKIEGNPLMSQMVQPKANSQSRPIQSNPPPAYLQGGQTNRPGFGSQFVQPSNPPSMTNLSQLPPRPPAPTHTSNQNLPRTPTGQSRQTKPANQFQIFGNN